MNRALFYRFHTACFLFLACYTYGQEKFQILEDDEYNFSIMTPSAMTLDVDTLELDAGVRYLVYSGSYVTEQDTMYLRIDLWNTDNDHVGMPLQDERIVLDSTIEAVSHRLRGELLFKENIRRNGWPAILARYRLDYINRAAKVLVIKRRHRFYLLTVVASPHSIQHKWVNRFLHSLQLEEVMNEIEE